MPKFIIERSNFEAVETVLREDRRIRLARTFLLGGRVFDVYIPADRDTFNRQIRLPASIASCADD